MTDRRHKVAVVHPWMPHYRVEFFERLKAALAVDGIDLSVAHGENPPFALDRGDHRSLGWAHALGQSTLQLGGRTLVKREQWQPALDADLLILEDALRNLDTYAYLARRKRRHLPTAFWGPGQTLDRETGHLEAACKRTLLKRGDWWFAYTQGCADHLASTGIPRESITIVGNTFDTESLAAAASGITGLEVATKRAELGLTEGHSALFIGGLAAVKNLDLLIESGRLVSAGDPAFRVVVVGDGPMRAVVEQASRDLGFVVTCGPLFDPREKALVAAACDLIAAPGLVGLVAVDSLVLGRPIVTVKPWHHSPEIEYLTDGETAIFAKPLPSDYARALSEMLGESDLRKRLQAQCIAEGLKYSLGQMVERFQTGVHAALAAR